jgi:tetratricopeptide (TPR) repeat protein
MRLAAKVERVMRKKIWLTMAALSLLARPAAAIRGYSPADWDHARNAYSIGIDLVQHQKIAEAIPYLDAALNQYPDHIDLLVYLSYAHRRVAEHRTGTAYDTELRMAEDFYRRVLDIDSDPRDLQVYLGELYLDLHDPKAAAEELKVLDGLCPGGCTQRERLAASLARYMPPRPAVLVPDDELPPPLATAPTEATAPPTPISPPAPERD